MRNRRTLARILQHSMTCLPANSRAYMNYFGDSQPGFVGSKLAVSKLKDYRDVDVFDGDFTKVMFPGTPTAKVSNVTDEFVSFSDVDFNDSDFLSTAATNFDMIVGMSKAIRNPNQYNGQEVFSQTIFAAALDPHVPQSILNSAPFPLGNERVIHEVIAGSKFVFGNMNVDLGNAQVREKLEAAFSHAGAAMFSLDPYIAMRDESYGSSSLFLTSSQLEYNPSLPSVRFCGGGVGYAGSFTNTDFDYDLLRIQYQYSLGEPNPNKSCYFLALRNEHRLWMCMPLVVFKSGNRVAGLSAVHKGGYVSRGFHRVGFTPNSELEAESTSINNIRTSNVISFVSPSASGGQPARYVVEKRLTNLVNFTLTSHLPFKNPDGSNAEYFGPKGTFLGASHQYYEDCNRRACLQPVAFPWCQQKDSLDLYFISMDDNYRYWLNKMRLGSVNSAEALMELSFPPTEMVAHDGKIYMAYDDGVHLLDMTTLELTLLTTLQGLLTNRTLAISVDEANGDVWFGHDGGLTNYTANLRYGLETFTNSTTYQLGMTAQSLTVLNGVGVWLSGQSNFYSPHNISKKSYANVFDSNSGNYQHLSWEDVSDSYVDTPFNTIYAVSLRSNSELVIIRDVENTFNKLVGISIFKYTLAGKNRNNKFKLVLGSDKFNFNLDDENSDGTATYRILKLIRVTDSKYVTGTIPNNSKFTRSQFDSASMRNVADTYRKSSVYREIQINDDRIRIELDPYLTNAQGYHLTKYPQGGVPENVDPINAHDFAGNMFPDNSLSVRDVDFEHCVRSFGIVRYNNTFAPMFAGFHIVGHGGLLQDFQAGSWAPHQYGSLKSKAVHLDFQSIGDLNIKFTNRSYAVDEIYRVDSYPTTDKQSVLTTYLGDYEIVTHTVTLSQPTFTSPEALKSEFQGVDFERHCVVTRNAVELTRVSGPTINPGQYTVTKDGVFKLNPADIGAVQFEYLVVKAVL